MNDIDSQVLAEAITVVVPTYNRAATLRVTLESLVAQTVHCRLVVVDDGSEDNTETVCREFGTRVDYVRYAERVGLFANWNRAVRQARTDLVAVFHDDDVYEPTIVERGARLLLGRPDMVMAHTGCHFIDDEGRKFDRFTGAWPAEIAGDTLRRALAGRFSCPIAAPSVMLRREALSRIGGFDEDLRVCGDIATWLKIGTLGTVGYVDDALVRIRVRGRHANEHAIPDWSIIEEHLRIAETGQIEIHGSLTPAYRMRRDAYLLPFVLRELFARSRGDMDSVLRRHASWPVQRLATILPRLSPLAPIVERGRPLTRAWLVGLGKARRRQPTRNWFNAGRQSLPLSTRFRLSDQMDREKAWEMGGDGSDEATLHRRSDEPR